MPEYTPFANIPIPLWGEPDQVPPDMKRMALAIEQGLVIRVPTRADLTGSFNGLPAHTLAVVQADDSIWIKLDGGGWRKVWSDTGFITSGVFSPASGWIVLTQWARVRAGTVHIWVQLQRTGADIVFDSNANSIPLGSITAAYLPPGNIGTTFYGGGTFGQVVADSTGAVRTIYVLVPGNWQTGEFAIFQFAYPEAGA